MSTATDILGKVGQKVGNEIATLETNIENTYATQDALQAVSDTLANYKSNSSDFWVYYQNETELNANFIHGAFAHVHDTGYAYFGHNNAWVKLAKFSESATKTELTNGLNLKADQTSLNTTNTNLSNLMDGTTTASKLVATDAEFSSLKVSGETTIVNTTKVEVSDNIIELNKAEDGTSVADTSGIEINRGADPKASLKWDNLNNKWQFLVGTSVTDVKLDDLEATSVNVPTGSGMTINAVALGDYATFESAFISALGSGGGGDTADIIVAFDPNANWGLNTHQYANGGTFPTAPTHLAVLVGGMGNKTPVSGGETITNFINFPMGWYLLIEGDANGNYTGNAVLVLNIDSIETLGDHSINDLQVYDSPVGGFRIFNNTEGFEADPVNLTTGFYFGNTNPLTLTLADATKQVSADQATQAFSNNSAEITIA